MNDEHLCAEETVRDEIAQMRAMAMQLLCAQGELGHVLQFFRDSWTCASVPELARALLHAMEQYDLGGVVQLRLDGAVYTLNSEGRSSPMEQEMLAHLQDERRMVDYGSRTLVNYPHVSLLVRNMPMADTERYGRMRDNLCYLAENADVRVRALGDALKLAAQNSTMRRLADSISHVLRNVDARFRQQQSRTMSIFMDFNEELTSLFIHLGLTDTQENQLAEAAARANHSVQQAYDDGFEIDRNLRGIMAELAAASGGIDTANPGA